MENVPLIKAYPVVPALSGQVDRLSTAIDRYGEIQKYFGAFDKPIGLEFETEGAGEELSMFCSKANVCYWNIHQDGSLKDRGIELVSLPVNHHNIDYALHEIEDLIKLANGAGVQVKSSIRTSIHVHADVSGWGMRDLYWMAALYVLFEPLFFGIQSDNRRNNPFCWEMTDILPEQLTIMPDMKYCALNFAPVATQLSVEFRHGDFNTDMRVNRRWIQVVCKFMRYADQHREELREIIHTTVLRDEYYKLFDMVMGKSRIVFDGLMIEEEMKSNVLWSLCLLEAC